MSPENLERFRTKLESQLNELQQNTQVHQQQIDENQTGKDFVGGDRATELELMEVDTAVAESEIRLSKKIEHALARIKDGTYGICEGCGEEIPLARLEAKPSVSLCLFCQEEHEAEVA